MESTIQEVVRLKVYDTYFSTVASKATSTNQGGERIVENAVNEAIENHPEETDIDTLTEFAMEIINAL